MKNTEIYCENYFVGDGNICDGGCNDNSDDKYGLFSVS